MKIHSLFQPVYNVEGASGVEPQTEPVSMTSTTPTADGATQPPQQPTQSTTPNTPNQTPDGKPASAQDSSDGKPQGEPAGALQLSDLDLPEGFDPEDALAGEFVDLLNKTDPTDKKGMADAILGLYEKVSEQNMKRWFEVQQDWRTEIENDPQYGGDKLQPALGNVSKLINQFASAHGGDEVGNALRTAFDNTGAGNNPHIVKFLIWTSQQLSEGRPLSGAPAGGEVSRAQKLFGT